MNGGNLGEKFVGDGGAARVLRCQLSVQVGEKVCAELAGFCEPAPATAHCDAVGDIGECVSAQ